jgi:hypothetical protein
MNFFLTSLVVLLMSLIVSVILIPVGIVYSLVYSIWLSITLKDWKRFFKFWWKLLDGLLYSVGHVFYNTGFALDLIWNVNGEILEDMITSEENTTFGDKETTVSASVGKLEIDDKLNNYGKFCTKILNIVFWQKAHAVDSWNYQLAKKELKSKYFEPKKIKK